MSEEMKRFLQEELKKEANEIMREVDADQDVESLTAPSKIDEKLYEQIRQYKEEQEVLGEKLSTEQQELIRLGKIYKRKQKRRKYVVLAAAVMAAFAVGITSVGGPERIFRKFSNIMAGRDQMVLNSDDQNVIEAKASTEEEAYQRIKDEFGFEPVRMLYLPQNMEFQEATILGEIQDSYFIYSNEEKASVLYYINVNYNTSSFGVDVEDTLVKEYDMEIDGVCIHIKQYQVSDSTEKRSRGSFEYDGIQYFIIGNGLKEAEFEKILKNLHFFKKIALVFLDLCVYIV